MRAGKVFGGGGAQKALLKGTCGNARGGRGRAWDFGRRKPRGRGGNRSKIKAKKNLLESEKSGLGLPFLFHRIVQEEERGGPDTSRKDAGGLGRNPSLNNPRIAACTWGVALWVAPGIVASLNLDSALGMEMALQDVWSLCLQNLWLVVKSSI